MHRSRSWLPSKMAALWKNLVVATWLVLLLAQTPIAFADTCTFDDGLCDWETGNCSKTACFRTFKVADSPLGPAYDHTNKTDQGSCAYSVPSTSKVAFRTSEIWRNVKGPFCFTAWYHQSGPLHEDATFKYGENRFMGTEFYRTQPEMAGRWQRVRYSERRVIEGMIRIRHAPQNPLTKGVFVVDDLTVEKGECPADPVDGSCDFDLNSTCGYDLGKKEGGWQLQAARATKFVRSDFSTNTYPGGVLFLQTGRKNFTAASFVSPKLPARTKVQCLRFYYYISRSFPPTKTGYGLKVTATGDSGKVQTIWYRTSNILVRGMWSAADVAFKVEEGFKVKTSRPDWIANYDDSSV